MKDVIKETVRNGELKDFVLQDASPSSHILRGTGKGKQKVKGTIHVVTGTDKE